MLPRIEDALAKLEVQKNRPSEYKGGSAFWDDLCLARFLKGVCLRYVAYPVCAPIHWCNTMKPINIAGHKRCN